jgi:hypothetical protein
MIMDLIIAEFGGETGKREEREIFRIMDICYNIM